MTGLSSYKGMAWKEGGGEEGRARLRPMDTYHLTPRQEGIADELPRANSHGALVRHGCALWGGVVNVPGEGGSGWVR